jgi:hypothetical protein
MNDSRQQAMLSECIERLQAGETVAACLARYGAEAAAIAPLLSAAARLRGVQPYRLSADQRGRARAALRTAMLAQTHSSVQPVKVSPWRIRVGLPHMMRRPALAALLAAALFLVGTATAVAASQPGDVAYRLRVIVERAPALFETTAAARATAELHIADRRLADVERYLAGTGQVEHNALVALLSGDQAAANQEATAPLAERAAVAVRVMDHARALSSLAGSATEAQTRTALDAAAAQALAIAASLEPGGARPATPSTPGIIASPSPTQTPTALILVGQPTPVAPTPTQADPTPSATAAPPYGTATANPTTRGNGPQHTVTPQAHHGTQTVQAARTAQATQTPQATRTPGDGPQPTPTEQTAHTPQATHTPHATRTPGDGPQPTVTPRATHTAQGTQTPQATRTPGDGPQPTATPQATRTPKATQTPHATRTPGDGPQPTRTPGTGRSLS